MFRLILRFFVAAAFLAGSSGGWAQSGSDAADSREETVTLEFLHPPDVGNWLPMSTARGAPTFRVQIGEREVCGLFDTGSSRTIIDLGLARDLGLRISDTTRSALTLGMEITARRVWAVPVEVSGQFRLRSSLFGIDMPDLDCADGTKLAFVLGSEFINVMAVVVDNPANRILFHKSGSITPLDNFVHLDWTENTLVAQVNGREAALKVDTGSASDLSIEAGHFADYFSGAEVIELSNSTAASGRLEENIGLEAVEYSIGEISSVGTVKRIADRPDAAVGNLGYPLFADSITIFDAAQDSIWVLPMVTAHD